MRGRELRLTVGASSVLGTALVALLWGTSGALVRHLPLPAAEIACLRAAVGAVTLTIWLTLRRCIGRAGAEKVSERYLLSLVLSGVLLAAHWLTFVMALQHAPVGTVLTGIYLAPIVIAMLAYRTLGEKVGRAKLLAVLVAVAGSAMVLRPGVAGGREGVLLTLFSAVAYAGSILASKKALGAVSPAVVATGQLGVTALVLAPVLLLGFTPVSLPDAAVLTVLGVVYSAIAMLAYLASLRGVTATTSAILLCLEPVSGFITGWIFLDEQPSPLTAVGALTVLAAGTFATLKTSREDQPQPEDLAVTHR
jgi:drug/metabolite transporter (DMT)-like permease